MRARRTSTVARWKTCKKALSTAISPRSAEAIWRLSPGRYLLMSHRSFVWFCLLPLAVVTVAFFLLPMARLVVTGAEGPQGLAGYLAILTEPRNNQRSEEHTSELQSRSDLVCRLLLEKKNQHDRKPT